MLFDYIQNQLLMFLTKIHGLIFHQRKKILGVNANDKHCLVYGSKEGVVGSGLLVG